MTSKVRLHGKKSSGLLKDIVWHPKSGFKEEVIWLECTFLRTSYDIQSQTSRKKPSGLLKDMISKVRFQGRSHLSWVYFLKDIIWYPKSDFKKEVIWLECTFLRTSYDIQSQTSRKKSSGLSVLSKGHYMTSEVRHQWRRHLAWVYFLKDIIWCPKSDFKEEVIWLEWGLLR